MNHLLLGTYRCHFRTHGKSHHFLYLAVTLDQSKRKSISHQLIHIFWIVWWGPNRPSLWTICIRSTNLHKNGTCSSTIPLVQFLRTLVWPWSVVVWFEIIYLVDSVLTKAGQQFLFLMNLYLLTELCMLPRFRSILLWLQAGEFTKQPNSCSQRSVTFLIVVAIFLGVV